MIYTSTVMEKESLQNNIRWVTLLKVRSKIVIIMYDVITHDISVHSIKMKDQ